MKTAVRVFVSIIAVMVFSVLGYTGIVLVNNRIATNIESELVKYELPANTVLIESYSNAGKMVGCGNGMQYMGCLLVESDLTAEELNAHYSTEFDDIEVYLQKPEPSGYMDGAYYSNRAFANFSPEQGKTYYTVTCWDFGGSHSDILDFDIRGH